MHPRRRYRNEGISWKDVDFFNNAVICDLIEAPRSGILAILDEACLMVGNQTDLTVMEHMDRTLGKHAHYTSRQVGCADKDLARLDHFRLKHFAGDVDYSVHGFIEKNKDTLFQDLKRLLYNSGDDVIKRMWMDGAQDITEVRPLPATPIHNSHSHTHIHTSTHAMMMGMPV